ncbi:IS5 family transposase [Serratia liquefaciens]|nr:IS5 family transposase [Serratia liquefaciens]
MTRWEKKVENYEAILYFSYGIIAWNKILSR